MIVPFQKSYVAVISAVASGDVRYEIKLGTITLTTFNVVYHRSSTSVTCNFNWVAYGY
ncbi:MAG: hypothetical protein KBS60_01225 [Phascolarctobacterium sp.]|nr:hypothetical protein [Candidatus Phascolarctobacterium caballi]